MGFPRRHRFHRRVRHPDRRRGRRHRRLLRLPSPVRLHDRDRPRQRSRYALCARCQSSWCARGISCCAGEERRSRVHRPFDRPAPALRSAVARRAAEPPRFLKERGVWGRGGRRGFNRCRTPTPLWQRAKEFQLESGGGERFPHPFPFTAGLGSSSQFPQGRLTARPHPHLRQPQRTAAEAVCAAP